MSFLRKTYFLGENSQGESDFRAGALARWCPIAPCCTCALARWHLTELDSYALLGVQSLEKEEITVMRNNPAPFRDHSGSLWEGPGRPERRLYLVFVPPKMGCFSDRKSRFS